VSFSEDGEDLNLDKPASHEDEHLAGNWTRKKPTYNLFKIIQHMQNTVLYPSEKV